MTITTIAMGRSWSWEYTRQRHGTAAAVDVVRRVVARLPGSARWRPGRAELVYDISDAAVPDDLVTIAEGILADEYRRRRLAPPEPPAPRWHRFRRGRRRSIGHRGM